jgi:uncharacterized protein
LQIRISLFKGDSMTVSVASYRSPKTRVLSSKTHGRGLFATKRIPKGEIVTVRGGHILTRPMLKQRRLPPGYWGYPIADGFVLGPLTKRETESVMIFLNHSCEPNVGIQGQIVFVAMREIRVGEELTIDYAMFGTDTKRMRCRCGATACRKISTNADWRLKALQKKYAGYFSWRIVKRLARRSRKSDVRS